MDRWILGRIDEMCESQETCQSLSSVSDMGWTQGRGSPNLRSQTGLDGKLSSDCSKGIASPTFVGLSIP
ncbi:MAG: hypothetical protein JWN15_76 [Firmicutes bacterium]|nr:hypothetical protein [Bacillota bacterium]